MTAKTKLPNIIGGVNYTSEYSEYETLYMNTGRSQSGNITFTSTSSGTTYNTNTYIPVHDNVARADISNKGQEGMLNLLYDVLEDFLVDDEFMTEITDALNAAVASVEGKQDTITGGAETITSTNLTANRALVSDSNGKVAISQTSKNELEKLSGLLTTKTELGYVSGVTSNIQAQLNNKVNNEFSASRALVTSGDGGVVVSDTTSSELTYVHGVTSNIQTQLNNKQKSITYGTSAPTGGSDGDIYIQYD